MKNQVNKEERDEWKKNFTKRLITFSVQTLKFCHELETEKTLRPVADQLVRSATSVGANVCEAQGAPSKRDFTNFFHIALKSAKETQYWLVVIDQYKTDNKEVRMLLEEVKEISRIISSSLLTMKGRQ